MVLTEISTGKEVVIKEVLGGQGVRTKLELLGLRIGQKIKKVSEITSPGPIILEIVSSKSRVAIGYGIVKKIVVEP